MAFDATFRTTQEYLNRKAGFTGTLRTKQECLASLSGRKSGTIPTAQDCANSYASTAGKEVSEALNNKVGYNGNTLTEQEAARRL